MITKRPNMLEMKSRVSLDTLESIDEMSEVNRLRILPEGVVSVQRKGARRTAWVIRWNSTCDAFKPIVKPAIILPACSTPPNKCSST